MFKSSRRPVIRNQDIAAALCTTMLLATAAVAQDNAHRFELLGGIAVKL